jgi:hypothetical protein
MPARAAAARTTSHGTFAVILEPPDPPGPIDRAEVGPVSDARHGRPGVDGRLDPSWDGHHAHMPRLANEVGDGITLQRMLHEWAMHDLRYIRQIAELVRARKHWQQAGPLGEDQKLKP